MKSEMQILHFYLVGQISTQYLHLSQYANYSLRSHSADFQLGPFPIIVHIFTPDRSLTTAKIPVHIHMTIL